MMKTAHKILFLLAMNLISLSMYLMLAHHMLIIEWEMFNILSSTMKMELMLEWSSMMYSSIVMFISANVLMFSKEYMKNDLNKLRFTAIILLFITSMNLLILIPNMACLLIGWDGLGITSFILVMYYNNSRSLAASMLTILTNRFGDTFILLAIVISLNMGNWSPIYNPMNNQQFILWLSIMIAAMTKSAQMPFSGWLPAAMAAPTPVSALVHSSTLVTAGIFILYRFNYMISSSKTLQLMLLMVGMSTTMIAGISAFYEPDMKKIIALSTLSQLGFMMMSISMNMPMLAFFHMSTHAMFKALLFIAAGCLISLNNHNQDMHFYSQFFHSSPMITSSLLISSISMMGVPFMSGYYSKHMIMEWSSMLYLNMLIFTLLLMTIFLTSYYSIRLMMSSLMIPSMTSMYNYNKLTYSNMSLIIMSPASIFFGSIFMWLTPKMTPHLPIYSQPQHIMMNMMITMAMLLAMIIYKYRMSNNTILCLWYKIFLSLSFMNQLFTQFISPLIMGLSMQLYKHLDNSWLEKMTSLGLPMNITMSSLYLNNTYTNSPQKSMLYAIGSTILFFWLINLMTTM